MIFQCGHNKRSINIAFCAWSTLHQRPCWNTFAMRSGSVPTAYLWQLCMLDHKYLRDYMTAFHSGGNSRAHLELCSGCNHAREEACPGSAHFAPVIDAALLTELGKGISAARSYRFQLHTGNYFCHKEEWAMTWKAVFKHVMGEPLLCTIRYCTRLREKTGLGHPASQWQIRLNIFQCTTIY